MDDTDPVPMSSLAESIRKEWGLLEVRTQPAPFDVREAVRRQRLETFHRFCPPEFHQKIDMTKIRNQKAWADADKWQGEFPGVWLWSKETGEAKTRMLWRKFGQLHVDAGLSVQRVTGLNLAEEYADCFRCGKTAQFYRHLCGTDVVMLDDLDKMPLPDEGQGFGEREAGVRGARMLRELFDTFYEEHTRVLVTANQPIQWFEERIGPSAERRMRTVCTEIEF